MFGEPRNPIEKEICELEQGLLDTKKKIQELRTKLPEEEIQNYQLKNLDGETVDLKSMFNGHDEMLLIHNMGPGCPYCTLWADGFRTMKPYFDSRCAFVLETDRNPEELKIFQEKRGWDYPVISSFGSSLKTDLGFKKDNNNFPGVSSLFLKDDKIFRHATAPFGPGDDFCFVWPFLDLLKHSEKTGNQVLIYNL